MFEINILTMREGDINMRRRKMRKCPIMLHLKVLVWIHDLQVLVFRSVHWKDPRSGDINSNKHTKCLDHPCQMPFSHYVLYLYGYRESWKISTREFAVVMRSEVGSAQTERRKRRTWLHRWLVTMTKHYLCNLQILMKWVKSVHIK